MRSRVTDPGTIRPWIAPVMFAALLLAGGCSLEEPSAPSWEIELNIPLSNTAYDLPEILPEDEFTATGPDSIYTLEVDGSIDPVRVTDEITVEGFDRRVGETVGDFTVPAPVDRSAAFTLAELFPAAAGGYTGIIPAFTFPTVTRDLTPFEQYTQVTIDSGYVTLAVTNNTPVPISTLQMRLLESGSETEVLTADFSGAVPIAGNGGTGVVRVSLAGVSMSNDLSIEMEGSSDGSGGDPVTVTGEEEVVVEVSVSELKAASATGEVGAFSGSHTEEIDLDAQSEIHAATFAGGSLQLEMTNQLPVDLDVAVAFPTLSNTAGSPCTVLLQARSGQTVSQGLDLSGWTLETEAQGNGVRRVPVSVDFSSPGSVGEQVTMAAADSVVVHAVLDQLAISELRGVLNAETVPIEPSAQPLFEEEEGNLLDELRKVGLSRVELELVVESGVDFPAQVDLDLTGRGGVPDPVTLDISFPIRPGGTPGMPVTSTYLIDGDSPDHQALLDFINAFPDSVEYSGEVTVGDAAYEGEVRQGAEVSGQMRFRTPLELTVNETLRFESDIQHNEEGLEDEVDRIQEATITYAVSTTTNMPMRIAYLAARDSNRVFSDPDLSLELSVTGILGTEQDTVVTLGPSDFDLLKEPVYTGLRVLIPPSGAAPYRISRNDQLFVRAFGTVRLLIDPDEDQGGGGGR
ncbi:MAG: hypothetical protein R6W82_04995 [bacterium]